MGRKPAQQEFPLIYPFRFFTFGPFGRVSYELPVQLGVVGGSFLCPAIVGLGFFFLGPLLAILTPFWAIVGQNALEFHFCPKFSDEDAEI